MPISTDSGLSTWPIEEIKLSLVQGVLECDAAEAKRRRTELAKLHRDPSWLDATVARLPVPALCIAAVLAGRGGLLRLTELEQLAAAKFGLTPSETDAGAYALLRELLVAPLSSATSELLALVSSAADALAERVAELELVPVEGSFTPARDTDGGRMLVGIVSALASFELVLTRAGSLHRTGVKKLAKQLGLSSEVIETNVITALNAGLLQLTEAGVLVIDRDSLLAAAEGRYPEIAALAQLRGALERCGAVALPGAAAFMASAERRGRSTLPAADLERLPGFCAGTIGAVPVLKFDAPTGSAAASVTPSFEAIMPPESRLADLVRVLEVCETNRIDRAIVGRITKASITRAIGRGLTADEILDGLKMACRTAVPQNVTAAIVDWAGGTIAGTIASGTVIAVPPSEEARVRKAFVAAHPRAIAPGVLVLEGITERAAAQILRKLGILDRALEPTRLSKNTSPAAVAPPAGLGARLVAYRRGDPLEPKLVPVTKIRSGPTSAAQPSAATADHEVAVLVERLERWESQHGSVLPLDMFDIVVDVLATLPLQDRTFLFGARSDAELRERLVSVVSRPATLASLDGEIVELLGAALGHPQIVQEDGLQWDSDHVYERLEAAARVRGEVVLDLGRGARRTIAVSKVARRGDALIVFGEDDEAISHAIRVAEIIAVADPSTARAVSTKWRPAQGMSAPAGHVRCPCGRPKRYRECCRVAD